MRKVYFISMLLPIATILILKINTHSKESKVSEVRQEFKERKVILRGKVQETLKGKVKTKKLPRMNQEVPKEIIQVEKIIDQKIQKLKELISQETKEILKESIDLNRIKKLRDKRANLTKEVKSGLKIHQEMTWLEMKKINPYKNQEAVREWAKMKREKL